MVIFIRPPDGGGFVTSYSKTEALGIEYNCAVLMKNGIDCKYLDFELFPSDREDFSSMINANDVGVVGISLNYPHALRHLSDILKALEQGLPNVKIVVGGHYASSSYSLLLKGYPEIDFVFRYEAEPYLVDFINTLQSGSSLIDFPNLAYRSNDGIAVTESGRRCFDLDALPYPYRPAHIIDHLRNHRQPVSVIGSRGCWWGKCGYCAISQSYADSKWIARSPDNIVSELYELYDRFGFKDFAFVDAEFLGPPNSALVRAQQVTEAINKRALDISYSVNLRPENVMHKTLEVLRASGLSLVYIGIESVARSHVKRWCRATSPKVIETAIIALEKAEIPFRAGFMMFDLLSTLDDLEENIEFLLHHPIIEPSLIVRGLELREGMPIKSEYDLLLENNTLYDNYFLDKDTALFVKIVREVSGRILLFLHKLNELKVINTMKFESEHSLDKSSLIFLLQKMKALLELFRNKGSDWVAGNIDEIKADYINDVDNYVCGDLLRT